MYFLNTLFNVSMGCLSIVTIDVHMTVVQNIFFLLQSYRELTLKKTHKEFKCY